MVSRQLDLRRREAIGLNVTAAVMLFTAGHMPGQSQVARDLHVYAQALIRLAEELAGQAGHRLPPVPAICVAAHASHIRASELRRQEAVALHHVSTVMRGVADALPIDSAVTQGLYRAGDELSARAGELAAGDPRRLPPHPSAAMPLPKAHGA